MRTGVAVLLLGLAAAATGCGSSGDCTEKATCADPGDGATGADVPVGSDGSHGGDAGQDGTGGVDAAHDGTSGADSSTDGSSSDVVTTTDSPATCSGVCADAVPAGWSGPVTLFDQSGTTAPTAPACPTSFPTDAYDGNAGLNAPNPMCGCTCTGGTGAQCGSSSIQFFTDSACQTPCNPGSYGLPPGLCVTTGCASNPAAFELAEPPVAFAGNCSPQTSSSIPPWAWSTTARACGTTAVQGACSGSGVCVPTPSAPFGNVCIFQAGTPPCPAGSYSVAHVFYGGVSDSRACSGCSCNSPTGVSCTGAQVQGFGMNTGTCGGTAVTLPYSSACQQVGVVIVGEQETTAPTANNGTCTSNGGQASGSATPATPTTVCCTP
jgi:hypothetical protein